MKRASSQGGFTLIEVLLALMIIAIGLTALLKTMGQNIHSTSRLKDKSVQHMVVMSALADIQSNTVSASLNHEITRTSHVFGHTWYWRAKITATSVKSMQQISVSASPNQTGPFTNQLIGYRYIP
ncbi:MAG: type II secretion system protein GspI [Legionella sp.]|nr:MAG: type II secretion system protein GspI [Legionella sp.]